MVAAAGGMVQLDGPSSTRWRALRKLPEDVRMQTLNSWRCVAGVGQRGRCAHRCQLRLKARIPSSCRDG